jgi:polar amino acid transport system substrate-binding protein
MKKFLAFLLIVSMAIVAFASCNFSKTIVVGYTVYKPMNYTDDNGNFVGFDTDLAKAVLEDKLGYKVVFKEIDWNNKYMELESGTIDCIWNGFTANSSDKINGVDTKRSDLVDFTYGYMLNQQCVVIKASNADTYKSVADLAGKTAGVEGGSAGESEAAKMVGENGKLEKYPAQNNSFLEVKTGAVDFAVVDIVLAKNICGQGDYADLMIVETIELPSEVYAVGFEKGSELTAKVNEAIKTLFDNGTIAALAKKYGFENVVQFVENID